MKTHARFYEKLNDKVHCYLCPHNCVIEDGNFGKCNVRINQNGSLYTINYGEITAIALDPIEKKPFYNYMPGANILSVGSFGCNFTCGFCQNYNVSQSVAQSNYIAKESLVEQASSLNDNIGIAFTYNEPSIWYEYVYDCAKLLKETSKDSSVALVTNGYISEKPLRSLLPYVDAMNIDLKTFNDKSYKKMCGGSLKPVLNTIEIAASVCHVEVTTLLVSGQNDNLDEIEEIANFLSEINPNIPLHLSRYFPRYKATSPATEISFMHKAKSIAQKHLNIVILGNI